MRIIEVTPRVPDPIQPGRRGSDLWVLPDNAQACPENDG